MRILRSFLSRAGQLLLVLLAVTLVVFVLTQVAPGDAARLRLGPRASQAAVDELRHQLGLDQSLPAQYVDYLARVLRGDLGVSVDGQQVTSLVAQRFSDTAWLVTGTIVASVLSAVALAWLAAMFRDRLLDHTLRLVMLLVLFLPSFWVGFLLIRLVAIPTGLFPVAGLGDTPQELVRALVLPSITGAISLAPVLVRSLRSSLIEVLDAEYIAVARSLGIAGPALAVKHVMRNALGPVITLLALNVGYLMFGVVVLEATFDIPGLGSALVLASAKQDVYVVQGITLVFAIGVVISTFLGETAVALLDPKVA
ncbi:ABC transporter permease [Mycobacterium sp. 21AC1]|uniref:ABC transporter permease n=1 Tax=[Mycobacterium] appelbergii TaxID=2939269 RepID=UPI00293915EE|nr:ABC transporter permease [Mycobacterium sp. 21AC1]MDV3125978.1 ABC transporter permease [Mycobacterium sp. 21AC1]